MTRLALLGLVLLALGGPAHAQGPTLDELQLGARVRLTASSGARTTVALLRVYGDTLLVRPLSSADTAAVALDGVRRVELSLGTRRSAFRGALLGYAAGFVVGGLSGFVLLDADQPRDSNFRGLGMAVGGWTGGLAGMVTGIVIGRRPVERWRTITIRGGASE